MHRLSETHWADDRGSMMIVMFFVLLVVTLLGVGYFSISLNSQRYSSLIQDSERSLYIAKAGIHRAEQYIVNRLGGFEAFQIAAPSWIPVEYQTNGYLLANETDITNAQILSADVFIITDTSGISPAFLILSRGQHEGTERLLMERFEFGGGISSLARYALFQNSNSMSDKFGGYDIWFIGGDLIDGPLHTNTQDPDDMLKLIMMYSKNELKEHPQFLAKVTTTNNRLKIRRCQSPLSCTSEYFRFQANPDTYGDPLFEAVHPGWQENIFQGGIVYAAEPLQMIYDTQTGSDFDAMHREAVRHGTVLPDYRLLKTYVQTTGGTAATDPDTGDYLIPELTYWAYTGTQTAPFWGVDPYDLGQSSDVPTDLVADYQYAGVSEAAQIWYDNPANPQSKVVLEKRKFEYPFHWQADYYVRVTDDQWMHELRDWDELTGEMTDIGFQQQAGTGDTSTPNSTLWMNPATYQCVDECDGPEDLVLVSQTEYIEIEEIQQWKIYINDNQFEYYYTTQTPNYFGPKNFNIYGNCRGSIIDYGEPNVCNDGGDLDPNDSTIWNQVQTATTSISGMNPIAPGQNIWGLLSSIQSTNNTLYSTGNLYVAGSYGTSASIISRENIYFYDDITAKYLDDGGYDINTFDPNDHPNFNYFLGLIALKDVVISQYFNDPDKDIDLHAAILATEGSFWYSLFSQDPASAHDQINLYGGLAQYARGPVGLSNGKGFLKNYVYDERFAGLVNENFKNHPPVYPLVKSGDPTNPEIKPSISVLLVSIQEL
ncbi:MAG: hypothetical protein ACE5JP_10795 [Candidatus Bipolaricaulia bacterium]